jgi:hypothetical protein
MLVPIIGERERELVMADVRSFLRPEFINRLDDVILFHQLTPSQLAQILDLMLKQEKQLAANHRFETRVSAPSAAGMNPLPTPAQFRAVVPFNGALFIAGAGGVFQYSLTGNLEHSWLTGRDLPPYPPVAAVAGSLPGDTRPKLWIATTGGLLAFDGETWRQLTLPDGYSRIAAPLFVSTGRLLFGAGDKGLFAFNGAAITAYVETLKDVPITALAGTEGDLWIGTRDRGLLHYRSGVVESFRESSGLPDDRILSILTAGDRAFAGTPLGVAEFRHGRPERILAEGVFSNRLWLDNDRLVIGAVDEGVLTLDLSLTRPSAPKPEDGKRLSAGSLGSFGALTGRGIPTTRPPPTILPRRYRSRRSRGASFGRHLSVGPYPEKLSAERNPP